MKKLNNKGFLLAETVIVSVFVLTIFVLVYQNSIPMIDEYENRWKYDDLDSVYSLGLIRNIVLGSTYYNNFISEVNEEGYKQITCGDIEENRRQVCELLFDKIGIEEGKNYVFLTKWDPIQITKNKNLSSGFTDYIFYIKEQNQKEMTEYRLLFSRTAKYTPPGGSEEDEVVRIYYANIAM